MYDSLNYLIPVLEIRDVKGDIITILSSRVNDTFCPQNITLDKNINECDMLSFSISARNEKTKFLQNESIIKFDGEKYIIKELALSKDDKTIYNVKAIHESVILKDKQCGKIEIIAGTVSELMNIALKDTGWVFGSTDIPTTDKRHLFSELESSFTNLLAIAEVYNAMLKFETKVVANQEIKSVSLYANKVDIGRYIKSGKDLKSLNLTYNTENMVTRLTVFGGTNKATEQPYNMMEAHPQNLPYVEDYSYFTNQGLVLDEIKGNPKYCKENTITVSELTSSKMVYDYGLNEIKKLCVPKIDASISILDFHMLKDSPWSMLNLNEIVHVFDSDINIEIEATITGISKNYSNPLETSATIANVIKRDNSKDLSNTGKVVNKITGSDGKIWGIYIANATIGSAQIGSAVIDTFHLKNGIIDNVHIKDLSVDEAKIKDASITSAKIANASVGNQHVSNLSADKMTAGTIDTAKVKIVGTDNIIEIIDGQILINDTSDLLNPKNRVIVGKYRKNGGEIKYGILIRGVDGKTVMWDENGATNAGITDGAVDDNKVSNNANINGSKLNIQTVIHSINNDTGAEKLNGMNIEIDGKKLDVKFTEINTITDRLAENISNNTSKIEQNAKEIALKVSQQDYIKGQQDITTSIGNVNNKLDNLRNGENMFTCTKTFASEYWDGCEIGETYQGFLSARVKGMGITKAPSTLMSKQEKMFAKEESFIITLYAKGKVEGLNLGISISPNEGYYKPTAVTTQWKKYTWTFKGEDFIGFIIGKGRIGYDRIGTNLLERFYIQSDNATDTNYIEVAKVMVSGGKVEKEWTPSYKDINKTITDLNGQVNDIVSDEKFTPNEKHEISREVDTIKAEKIQIDLQASLYTEVSELKSTYNTRYGELINYITPLILPSQLNSTSVIIPDTFKGFFNNYYDARNKLVTKISEIAKSKTDNAKAEAEKAQTAANNAKTEAEKAIGELGNIGKDNVVTPTEKITLDDKMKEIIKEKPSVINQAKVYSIVTTAYETAYTNLYDYMYGASGLLVNKTITTNIDKAIYQAKLNTYYETRQIVLDKVAVESKKASDNALSESQKYTDGKVTVVTEKLGTMNSEIAVMKDKINLKVEQADIDKTITEVKLGGRNKISKKRFDLLNATSDSTMNRLHFVGNNQPYIDSKKVEISLLDLKENDVATISWEDELITSPGTGRKSELLLWDGNTLLKTISGMYINEGRKAITKETFTIPVNTTHISFRAFNSQSGIVSNFNGYINNLKLEKGKIASEWTPAVEDINDNIDNSIKHTDDIKVNMENYINGAFRDGVLEDSEINVINEHLKLIDKDKASVDEEFKSLYNNSNLK